MVKSSANLQTFVSWMKNIKSFIKMLNRIGPKIVPCGTALKISRLELKSDPIFSRRYLSEKQSDIIDVAESSKP